MKKVIFILLIISTIASCSNEGESPGQIERIFYENAELSHSQNAGVYPNWNKGEKTILRFTFIHPEEPNISDDELSEHFWIEIPASFQSFEIDSVDVDSRVELYYTRACYCYIPEPFQFETVNVQGRKISNDTWNVSFEIRMTGESGSYELKDSGNYSLGTFTHD